MNNNVPAFRIYKGQSLKKNYILNLSPFLRACAIDTVESIKTLLNETECDIDEFSDDGYTALHLACRYNKNSGVIQFLINDLEMSIIEKTSSSETILMLACYKQSLVNIKYIVSKIRDYKKSSGDINFDEYEFIYEISDRGYNAAIVACAKNTLDVVKYLVEDLYFNCRTAQIDGFMEACRKTKNIDVLRYLVTILKINTIESNTFIVEACANNSSVDVLRYLIEELKLKCHSIHDIFRAIEKNKNIDKIVIYLIEKNNFLQYICQNLYDWYVIRIIIVIYKINHPVSKIFNDHGREHDSGIIFDMSYDEACSYLLDNNPELLCHRPFKSIELYLDKLCYETLKKLLLNGEIKSKQKYHINVNLKMDLFKSPFNDDDFIDLTRYSDHEYNELVFRCKFISNDEIIKYYCSKWWLYRVIPILKNADGFGGTETQNGICLEISQSKKVFNKYINACCTGKLDISDCDVYDIIELVYLMDMHPNVMFKIADIEMLIVSLMKNVNIDDLDKDTLSDMVSMCDKFKFKYLLMVLYSDCIYMESSTKDDNSNL